MKIKIFLQKLLYKQEYLQYYPFESELEVIEYLQFVDNQELLKKIRAIQKKQQLIIENLIYKLNKSGDFTLNYYVDKEQEILKELIHIEGTIIHGKSLNANQLNLIFKFKKFKWS